MITNLIFAEEIQILLDLPDDQKVLVTRSHNSHRVQVSEIEKKTGVIIIGIDSMSSAIPCPDATTHIKAGDVVFVMGRKKQLKRFLKTI
jgi:K+/H+ antiporter YhaU regulatory subunit KhtT